jgi:4-amino-4-deoxy-L-arabinose transferase-like glycosyltransferase
MADTLETNAQVQPAPIIEQKALTPPAPLVTPAIWQRAALGGIMVISLFMNFYQLGQNGFGNLYYAAGVRSMLDNLHNFFFVSFDPGGFVSIDKPPVGFWLQVVSAKIFGFTPFAVFLPQALAGVLSVVLLYHLVRRHFGVTAGLLAALALALSPISVVTNRNNTIDSTLALVLLLGAWAVMRAAETGKLRWLLLCAVTVGIGFNIKMLEAYLVVPAFGLLYLLAAPRSIWKRLLHLALAGLLLLAISLSWALAVDLTPASLRPYVGSSQDNSEISLALGYNGIERLLGQFGFGGRGNANAGSTSQPGTGGGATTGGFSPPGGFGGNGGSDGPLQLRAGGPGGTGGLFDTGTPGLTRLLDEPLAGQTAWLLPLALLGMVALAWQRRPRFRGDPQQQSLVLWGTWLLTMGVFFSVAGFFHQYYLTEMAPAIAALFGIGIVVMWQDYRRSGWRGWLLPLALIATALEQIHILNSYPAWGQWLIPTIVACCMLGALVLIALRLSRRFDIGFDRVRYMLPVLGVALLALMITPAVWAGIPVLQDVSVQLPVAGPTQQGGFAGSPGGDLLANGGAGADTALINYLEAHQGKATFLVATSSSQTADQLILETNRPIMALGGFSGSDPILTTSQLAALVKNGVVRFFLVDSFGGGFQNPPQYFGNAPEGFSGEPGRGYGRFGGAGGGPGGSQGSLTAWVTQNCTAVPSSQWQSASAGSGFSGAGQLYDCAGT